MAAMVGGTYPDHVVHGIDIRVAHVDPDGPQCEAILLAGPLDNDGGPGGGGGG